MSKKTLGRKIADLREEKGLTQDELADALKITRQRLSLIETDKRAVHSDILKQFAEYFNVSADYLIGLSEVSSLNTDIQSVCKYTGLSEEAVSKIKIQFSVWPDEADITNKILGNDYLWFIIEQLTFLEQESSICKDIFINDGITKKGQRILNLPKEKIDELLNKRFEIIDNSSEDISVLKCDSIRLCIMEGFLDLCNEYDHRHDLLSNNSER